jgi:hypothetical protein
MEKTLRRAGIAILVLALCVSSVPFVFDFAHAATSTTTLRPNSTVTGNWNTVAGTPGGTCTGHCDYVDEATPDGNTSYLQTTTASDLEEYGLQDITGGQTATSVTIRAYAERSATGALNGQDRLIFNLRIGSLIGAQQVTVTGSGANTYAWYSATFNGTWTQAQINSAQAQISKTVTGGLGLLPDTFRLSTVETLVTWQTPDLDQTAYRIYQNANSTTPGTPLAATNTRADVLQDTQFRLRMAFVVSSYQWNTGTWGASSNLYKLQYAARSAASCSAQATGWGDVTAASTGIRWFDNATPADAAAIVAYGSDPTTSQTKTYQTYEEANTFTNAVATPSGNAALFDFSLQNTGTVTPGTSYCFKVVKNDNTALTTYSTYPEVVITKDYGIAIVDAAGTDVAAPLVNFGIGTTSTTQCSLQTAVLGTSSQRIRINNDLVTNGWNVSIAATGGPTARWTAGVNGYDFNDSGGSPAGCTDGGDADPVAGQLRVNPSASTVTPETAPTAGCTATGVTKGSDAVFNQGATDSITLAAGSPSAQRFCYWDMTNIALEQRIPIATPPGTYTIDMTVTMTAL